MDISQEEISGFVCVKMTGRLDAGTTPDAERVFEDIQSSGKLGALLDLGGLEYISSVGLRVILTLVKELGMKDGKVVLCCLSDYVKEIFEVSGFTAIIPIAETIDAGIEALS
jgi:anti-sigma B factor antagonist